MAPRHFTNPAPRTESARQAVKSFYCELCDKGYARMNEFEAHESSYDHQHKKRLKEMKQMQRDPNASDKARRAERRADEKSGLISIKPVKMELGSGKSSTGGFKKAGFKNAFGESQVKKEEDSETKPSAFRKIGATTSASAAVDRKDSNAESDTDDDYEYYDPRRPTGCDGSCMSVDP